MPSFNPIHFIGKKLIFLYIYPMHKYYRLCRSERAPTEKMARANAFWASCAARKAQAPHFHARHFSSSSARSSRFQAPGAWSFWRPRARRAPTKLQFFETQTATFTEMEYLNHSNQLYYVFDGLRRKLTGDSTENVLRRALRKNQNHYSENSAPAKKMNRS